MDNELYRRIISERSGTEKKWIGRIPGFEGYAEMSARRQADRLIREYVSNHLRQQLYRLPTIEKTLLDAGGLSYMSKTRSAKTKFQTFVDRIATDSPGYTGFFDAIKIGPDDLAVVYAFDEALLGYVDQFKATLDGLQDASLKNEGVDEHIRALDALTIEANEAYSMRDDVLKDIGGGKSPADQKPAE